MKNDFFNLSNHGLGGFDYFMCMNEMERADAIDEICRVAKDLWSHGTDPNYYIETIFFNAGIDMDSLTDEEIEKINNACR